MNCKICNTIITSPAIQTKEMMFGFNTTHHYLECNNCNALLLENIPIDLNKFYPENYYSFKQHPSELIKSSYLRKVKTKYILFNTNKLLGYLLCIGYKVPDYLNWLKFAEVNFNDAILDIGSGNGDILTKLCMAGFTNLQGIDPFLKEEFISKNGCLQLLRKSIFDEQQHKTYDFIMLNHSFEHMDDPQSIFKRLSTLVKKDKILLIRTPVNKSFASTEYKENWVDMDPPRHLIVHSKSSIELLAKANGFTLDKIIYDSTAFQFWGSEQYKKNIPLFDKKSYSVNKHATIFTELQMAEWKLLAEKLNTEEQGDQACFYLRKL